MERPKGYNGACHNTQHEIGVEPEGAGMVVGTWPKSCGKNGGLCVWRRNLILAEHTVLTGKDRKTDKRKTAKIKTQPYHCRSSKQVDNIRAEKLLHTVTSLIVLSRSLVTFKEELL